MARVRRNRFRARLCGAGTNVSYGDYSLVKDINALRTARKVIQQMTDAFFASLDNVKPACRLRVLAQFRYDLACSLLADIDFYAGFELEGDLAVDVEESDQRALKWEMGRDDKPRRGIMSGAGAVARRLKSDIR